MPSCCDQAIDLSSATGTLTVALAGNPNSGKTTIFNALTGLRQKVANYPGVTVEKKTGRCKVPDGRWVDIIDLPGTYSLISRSPDEVVAMEVLRGLRPGTPAPDAVIVVVDASNLQRNLYLVSQLIELGRPMVVALNMMDIAERRGLHVSPVALEKELGVPVIPVVGHKRQGIAELKAAILKAKVAPLPDFPLPEVLKQEILAVGGGLAALDIAGATPGSPGISVGVGHAPPSAGPGANANIEHRTSNAEHGSGGAPAGSASGDASSSSLSTQHSVLSTDPSLSTHDSGLSSSPRAWICAGDDLSRRIDRYQALAERLLIGDRAPDIQPLAGNQRVTSLLNSAAQRLGALGIDPMQADIEAHYRWIELVASRTTANPEELAAMGATTESVLAYESARARTFTDRLDAILIHKVWGLIIFALVMASLFVTIFWLAAPIMDGIEGAVGWLGAKVTKNMGEGPLRSLIGDGIFAGVGAVVVFVPQIALLFFFLAILEDSGYLARAAFLMDRLLAKVGLHGKSFIPLLSSFACAIPGIMATRTIDNRRDRLATILVAPFMSCSARLPVYTLLIGAFFAGYGAFAQAGIMLSLYVLGIVVAVGMAWIFKRTFLKGSPSAFILEMPTYKMPLWSQVGRLVWTNSREFLTKAGTTIFCLSVLLWALAYYPRLPEERAKSVQRNARAQFAADTASDARPADELRKAEDAHVDKLVGAAQNEYSIAGRIGHFMEPAIRPLGYDWKMGVGLIGAFAAREVFVSTLAITYGAGSEDDTTDLATAMRNDTYANGKPVWTPAVAVSLLVWFVLAMQCVSTLAIARRETGGWGWPLFMLVYMNGVAYVMALLAYQGAMRWFA